MKIPPSKMKSYLYKGDKQQDKWGRKDYRLCYFKWQPMTEEDKLKQYLI